MSYSDKFSEQEKKFLTSYLKKENPAQTDEETEATLQTWISGGILSSRDADALSKAYDLLKKRKPKKETRADNLILSWAGDFVRAVPTVYDKNRSWWAWDFDKFQYVETDETELLNGVRFGHNLGDDILYKKRQFVTALELEARNNKPPELPPEKIQFKDKVYDIKTGETQNILDENGTPRFFSLNTIPHELGDSEETPTLDYLFSSWVGKEHVKTLYEFLAYCCYRAYPIHIITVLNGSGRNGKGSFLKILQRFLGKNNLASTDLDLLSSTNTRFETYNLYRKLGAVMTETNFDVIRKTSLIKALSGDDLIRYEKKGGATIHEHSYAKLIIATNSLPQSEDNTDGMLRRWLIIDFPNQFPAGKDITLTVPEEEFRNLAKKVTRILPELIDRGYFHGQGSIEEQKKKYIETSNPFKPFVSKYCVTGEDLYIPYGQLFNKYVSFCESRKARKPSHKNFKLSLEAENFYKERTTKDGQSAVYVLGVKLKDSIPDFQEKNVRNVRNVRTSTQSLYVSPESDSVHYVHNVHSAPLLSEFPTPQDVLENLNDLGGRGSYTELEKLFPFCDLERLLKVLLEDGRVTEIKPSVFQVL